MRGHVKPHVGQADDASIRDTDRFTDSLCVLRIEARVNIHGQVPTKGLINTRRFVLGAVFVYQLALLCRFENGVDLRIGLKAPLRAA